MYVTSVQDYFRLVASTIPQIPTENISKSRIKLLKASPLDMKFFFIYRHIITSTMNEQNISDSNTVLMGTIAD